jgi:AcrR family transcriptional regulator
MDAQRDRAIGAATLRLLGENGYDALSIERVAKAAGVSKATIYRRFPNKLELVIGVLERRIPEPDLPDTGSGLADLEEIAERIRTFALNDHTRCLFGAMMVARSRNPELAEAMQKRIIQPRREKGREVIRRAVARGELSADCPTELVLDMIFGALFVRHARGEPVTAEAATELVRTVWAAIAGRS